MRTSVGGPLKENLAEDRSDILGVTSSGVSPRLDSSPARAIEAVMASISARFLGMVDAAIPETIREGDPDNLRRARLILSFTLVLILLGVETGIFFVWFLTQIFFEHVFSRERLIEIITLKNSIYFVRVILKGHYSLTPS